MMSKQSPCNNLYTNYSPRSSPCLKLIEHLFESQYQNGTEGSAPTGAKSCCYSLFHFPRDKPLFILRNNLAYNFLNQHCYAILQIKKGGS